MLEHHFALGLPELSATAAASSNQSGDKSAALQTLCDSLGLDKFDDLRLKLKNVAVVLPTMDTDKNRDPPSKSQSLSVSS